MEGKVRRLRGLGHQKAQGAGVREQQAETPLCRRGLGECGAEKCHRKKTLKLAERRDVVAYLVIRGGLSIQRAC